MYSFIIQPIIDSSDLTFIALGTLGLYLLRKVMINYLFTPLAKMFDIKDTVGIKKFNENCWYTFYYPSLLYFGYFVLYDKSFFPWNYDHYFVKNVYRDYVDFPEIRYYYLIQISFYVHMSINFLWETKRKDFFEYCIHHSSTLFLLFFSFMAGQQRIGANVLFIHDISDIFLHLSKALHYIHLYGKKKWADYCVFVTFFTFFFSFFYTRLYVYPVHIIYQSAFHETRHVLPASTFYWKHDQNINSNCLFFINNEKMCMGDYCLSTYYFLVAMMTVLFTLHIFWGTSILKMILRYALFNKKEDIRSDEEETSEIKQKETAKSR